MDIIAIILLIILILVALIVLLLVITLRVSVRLANNNLIVTLFNIKIYSVEYAQLIANVLKGEKVKFKVKILPLINSILFVGIKVKYQREYIDHIDAYIYGLLNLFSMPNIKRIDSFKYQRAIGENKIEVQVTLKIRLLNVILSQWSS